MRPEPKFKRGDEVRVCLSHQCNGSGYLSSSGKFDPIMGYGGSRRTLTDCVWVEEKQEWYYGNEQEYGAKIAEHTLTKLVNGKPVVEPTETPIVNNYPIY